MGPTRDADIAKFLAEQAENEAKHAKSDAAIPEWRWSSDGWGEWGAKPPPLSAEAMTPPEPTDDATKE